MLVIPAYKMSPNLSDILILTQLLDRVQPSQIISLSNFT